MKYNKEIIKKATQYYIEKWGLRRYKRGWLKGTCPNCGKKDKFGIKPSQDRTNCFSCQYNTPLVKSIADFETQLSTYPEIIHYLKGFEGAELIEFKEEPLKEVEFNLPEFYKPIITGDSLIAKKARKYLKSRGYDLFELALKGVGYCSGGRYFGRIIIPYYYNQEIIYFNARKFMGFGTKFDNPKMEDTGVSKSIVAYNIDALNIYEEIHLVESATNALTLGDNAVGLGGKTLSPYIRSLILDSPVKSINIILDPDAYSEALDIALDLASFKIVKLVKLPPKLFLRRKGKVIMKVDINEIGKTLTQKYIDKAEIETSQSLLTKKFHHQLSKRL